MWSETGINSSDVNKDNRKKEIVIIRFLICSILVHLVSLTFGVIKGKTWPCDHQYGVGLNLKRLLLGDGIMGLIVEIPYLVYMMSVYFGKLEKPIINATIFIVGGAYIVMRIIWFCISTFILFHGNLDCLEAGSGIAVYALARWVLFVIVALLFCSCVCATQCVNPHRDKWESTNQPPESPPAKFNRHRPWQNTTTQVRKEDNLV